jgi:hypothetical protein
MAPKPIESAGQREGQATVGTVFELMNNLLERIIQSAIGSGEIEVKESSTADGAENFPWRQAPRSKTIATPVAQNPVQRRNAIPARLADHPAAQGLHRAPANHTGGWKQNGKYGIEYRLK